MQFAGGRARRRYRNRMPYFAPGSLLLRELAPKHVRKEPRRRWFWSARSDLIVWLSDDGTVLGFQFCYDKDWIEHALTWMADGGFSHMRVDTGPMNRAAPLLVANGALDAPRILELFLRDCAVVPAEYVRLVCERVAMLAGREG